MTTPVPMLLLPPLLLLLALLPTPATSVRELSDTVNGLRRAAVGSAAESLAPSADSASRAALGFGYDGVEMARRLLERLPNLRLLLSEADNEEVDGEGAEAISECANDTAALMEAAASARPWALKFMDSQPKPPSALTYGNLLWLGNYDECLSSRGPGFAGTYCMTPITTSVDSTLGANATLVLGLCFPDSCSEWQVGNLTDALLREFVEIFGGIAGTPSVNADILECKIERWRLPWTPAAVCTIIFLCCLGLLICVATAFDVATQPTVVEADNDEGREGDRRTLVNDTEVAAVESAASTDAGDGETAKEEATTSMATAPVQRSTAIRLLLCFSALTNAKKLMDTRKSEGTLSCLHGIRFISMLWVILGHVYGTASYGGNIAQLQEKLVNDWTFQAVLNATVSVDTFFVLSGLLVAYLFFRELEKLGGSLTKVNWIMFYVHRYWRLTPPYLLVMATYVTLGQYFYEGPLYTQRPGGFDRQCVTSWWQNALYINNFFDTQCMGWGWYLANDMQFYVISPLFLAALAVSPALGLGLLSAVTLGSVTANGVHSTVAGLSAGFLLSADDFNNSYVKPWFRIPPYLVGMATGYALYKVGKRRVRIHPALNAFAWCAASAAALSIVYGLYNVEAGRQQLPQATASLYNASARFAWGACVAWVIFACVTGNGGWVNGLLSQPCFIALSRLTYCAYLVHPVIIYVFALTRRQADIWDNLTAVYGFLGNAVLAYGTAFGASLAFESPIIGVERVLRGRR